MRRFRLSILWLAAIFLVTGSAIGFAKGGDKEMPENAKKAKPTASPRAEETPEAGEVAGERQGESSQSSHERKQNHGFFVSQAAHCEDVDDPETEESPDFTAPEDCEGDGHGTYVSSVARSSAGKKPKGS